MIKIVHKLLFDSAVYFELFNPDVGVNYLVMDFSVVNFNRVNLPGTNFLSVNFPRVNFQGANFYLV